MSFEVISIKSFDKQAKRLSKKFPTFKSELNQLIISLETNPDQGVPIGHDCFKIRLAISSKNKGKRGGAGLITHLFVSGRKVFLQAIYDKSEIVTITNEQLLLLLSEIRS